MNRNLNEEFKTVLKEIIAPKLKEIGFKKSNLNFNRSFDDVIQLINIQKSQYNHSERLIFTVNIGFYNSRIFEISRNRTEPKFVTIDNCFLWGRSGLLIYGHDYWYELNFNSDFKDLVVKIEDDFRDHIFPLYERFQKLNSLIDFLRINAKGRPFSLMASLEDVSILEMEFGDFERGKNILIDIYKKAIIPTSTKHTTVYPDGKEEVRWSELSINDFHVLMLRRIANTYSIDL
jgi:hypothetical protein